MKKLGFPIKCTGEPLVGFDVTRAEVQKVFGPPHAYEDNPMKVPVPSHFWAFEFDCGLRVILAQSAFEEIPSWLMVFADQSEIEHIIRHIELPAKQAWKADPEKLNFPSPLSEEGVVWALWRQDDHGHKALIHEFEYEREAPCVMGQYEARGHKQTYWVEKKAAPNNGMHPTANQRASHR